MKSFQRKNKFKRFMQTKPVLLILVIMVIAFAWNIAGMVGKMNETVKNRKDVENKISELEQMKSELSSDIDDLNTDKGVEESIREKFGLAKEGEGMIIIVDDKDPEEGTQKSEKKGFFGWLKDLFK